jgi:hypothetical protein
MTQRVIRPLIELQDVRSRLSVAVKRWRGLHQSPNWQVNCLLSLVIHWWQVRVADPDQVLSHGIEKPGEKPRRRNPCVVASPQSRSGSTVSAIVSAGN